MEMHIAYLPSGIFQAYTPSGTVYCTSKLSYLCIYCKIHKNNNILEFRFTENKFIFYFILFY